DLVIIGGGVLRVGEEKVEAGRLQQNRDFGIETFGQGGAVYCPSGFESPLCRVGLHGGLLVYAAAVTGLPAVSPVISRASSTDAISRPSSREMRTILSTSSALLRASVPLRSRYGLSSIPTRTWPPSRIACVSTCHCVGGSITLTL